MNTPGQNSNAVAELAFGLMVMAVRNLYNGTSGTDMAPATVQRYETSLKHTQDFVWETYHKKDILLDEVSRQFVEDYEFWLKTSKKCCHNTATKYLKNFKM